MYRSQHYLPLTLPLSFPPFLFVPPSLCPCPISIFSFPTSLCPYLLSLSPSFPRLLFVPPSLCPYLLYLSLFPTLSLCPFLSLCTYHYISPSFQPFLVPISYLSLLPSFSLCPSLSLPSSLTFSLPISYLSLPPSLSPPLSLIADYMMFEGFYKPFNYQSLMGPREGRRGEGRERGGRERRK